MSAWLLDLKQTLRRLFHSPGLAAAAILSIGLGIAANATVFAMVSRFVLRPAPVGDPPTLLSLHTTQRNECCNAFAWPNFVDLREQAKSFSGVTGFYELVPASIAGTGEPERVWGQSTTTNYFDVTQLQMTLGRGFSSDEDKSPVIVLGRRLWQRRFAADPDIAGKSISLSGRPFTVVGVASRDFRGLDQILDCEFWVPMGMLDQLSPKTPNYLSRSYHWIQVAARLKPGFTREQAAAELNVIAQRLSQAHPDTEKDGGFQFEQAGSLSPREKEGVLLFLAALTIVVLLVLCIACANVTNLLLAQASARHKELAVRVALGATRWQLLRQMLTESVLLAFAGGTFGVVFSLFATRGLSAFHVPAPVPLDLSISVDWRVLLFAFAISAAAGLLFGLASAWVASRPVLSSALKGEDLLARPGSRWNLRSVLVVAQIAMSLVLLCATGLFLRSLVSAAKMDVGFSSRGVLMVSVDPRLNGYTPEHTVQFLAQLRQRAIALPGVVSVASTDSVPLLGGNRSDGFQVVGRRPEGDFLNTELYMATSGYFDTIGTLRVAGRDFGNENPDGPKVAIVNEEFVKKLLPGENPIGQRVTGGGATYEIIGVAKNIKSRTLGEEQRPVLYRSLEQTVANDPSEMGYSLLVRYAGGSTGLMKSVQDQIHALDPTLAVFNAQTMEEHLREALFLPRLAGALFGTFGLAGLLLAGVGLYSVISYSVSGRTREIGVRLALGAQVGAVQRMIVRQGMLLAVLAILLGFPAALALAKVSTSFLYGVRPHDAATFSIVPVFLASVALFACWIPARRAASVDPLTALRHE
ncbi:MAG: ABC transporter permease [Candidatus Acidiferrum sp.]